MQIKAITILVALVSAVVASPAGPPPTKTRTIPKVTARPPKTTPAACYTHTTSLYPKTCGDPRTTLDCVEIQCITELTKTLPCKTARCSATPTTTQWLPCRTTCRAGCATSTVYETAKCTRK